MKPSGVHGVGVLSSELGLELHRVPYAHSRQVWEQLKSEFRITQSVCWYSWAKLYDPTYSKASSNPSVPCYTPVSLFLAALSACSSSARGYVPLCLQGAFPGPSGQALSCLHVPHVSRESLNGFKTLKITLFHPTSCAHVMVCAPGVPSCSQHFLNTVLHWQFWSSDYTMSYNKARKPL